MEVCCRLDLESGDISISSSVRSRGKLHGIDGGGMMKLPKSPSILLNGKGGSRGFTSGEGLLAGVPRWLSLAKKSKHLCIFKTYGIIKKKTLFLVLYLNILTILKKPVELKAIKQLIGYKKVVINWQSYTYI